MRHFSTFKEKNIVIILKDSKEFLSVWFCDIIIKWKSVHILGPSLDQWVKRVETGFCCYVPGRGGVVGCFPPTSVKLLVFSQNTSPLPSHSVKLSAIVKTGLKGLLHDLPYGFGFYFLNWHCNFFVVWSGVCGKSPQLDAYLCHVFPVTACVYVCVCECEYEYTHICLTHTVPFCLHLAAIDFFHCISLSFYVFVPPPPFLFVLLFFVFFLSLVRWRCCSLLFPRHTSVTSRLALSNPISCWWRGWMRRWLLREWCRLSSHCPPTLKCKWNSNNNSYKPRRVSPPLLCAAWELSH